MGDRVPIPVFAGMLGGHVGNAHRIATLSTPARLDAMLIGVRDVGSTDVTAEIRRTDALAATTTIATATITAGQAEQQETLATPVDLLSGEILDVRITAGGTDAMTLSGWVEILYLSGDWLTTLARVKRSLNLVDTDSDEVLTEVIASISARMRRYMGRQITTVTRTLERYSHGGKSYRLQLAEWPLISVDAVQVDGEVVDAADRDVQEAVGHVLYGAAGSQSDWPRGTRHIEVTYTAGYAEVPDDIEQAATTQVAWDFAKRRRPGERSSVVDEGNVQTYMVDAWAPEVLSVMDRYRRSEVPG